MKELLAPGNLWKRLENFLLSDMKIEKKDLIGLVSRIIVGGVFIYAAFLKLLAPVEEFAYAIESYKIFPYKISFIIANIVPWFELYLGIFILTGVYTVYCSIISVLTFIVFEVLLLQAIVRNLPLTDCGCFGASHSNSIYTEFSLNLLWIFFSIISIFKGKFFSIDSYFEKRSHR